MILQTPLQARAFTCIVVALACAGSATPARAQFDGTISSPRPTGRVSFYTNVSRADEDNGVKRDFQELATSITYAMPERDTDGLIYGVDLRHARDVGVIRDERMSIYEGYVGARAAEGRMLLKGGHLWLNELGSLGSIAGGMVEARTTPDVLSNISAFRVGAFAGLEPNIFESGYAAGVKKFGVYLAADGERARRQAVGFVRIAHGALVERSVITGTNFLPVGETFFMYQAVEYDMSAPGGMARGGLNYFLTNARVAPSRRWDVQGSFSRGRSIDARGITEDALNGRSVSPLAIEGFLYESIGGRTTVEVAPRVRLNAGYARDKNNRDDQPTGRLSFGGYAGDLARSGFDVAGSDSRVDRASGPYHYRYVSVGHQIGRAVYLTGDVSTSLAVVRFSRSDGVVVEMRPHTTRLTTTANVNLGRYLSLMMTVDRTVDGGRRELRVLSGITYRLR